MNLKGEKIMAKKYDLIIIKNKTSFLSFYEKPYNLNRLKERIFWSEDKNDNNKVQIKIDKIYSKAIVNDILDELKNIEN